MTDTEGKLGGTLIGVGGWAYLPIRNVSKLGVCSKLYDFVEVNSTYYKLPEIKEVRSWRREVPDTSFEFTVRANRLLTHENHLQPTDENFKLFDKMLDICDELDAKVLHFQFPASLRVTSEVIRDWRDFFCSVASHKKNGIPDFAFEIRNSKSQESEQVKSFFEEYDIIPTSDPSRNNETPLGTSKDSGIAYSRVFGPGNRTSWSFDTDELKKIEKRVEQTPAKKRYVTFHNITMYEDASRMKSMMAGESRGRSDTATRAPVGLESFKRTLALANVEYPATKETLKAQAGWRTFDLRSGRRVHVGEFLERLPDSKKFRSSDEVIDLLSSHLKVSSSEQKLT